MTKDNARDYIDAHVHVWTADVKKYPLASGFTIRDMKPAAYLPEDLMRDAQKNGVNRIVLVQMSYYGFDNSFMLDTIRESPQVFRGVAVIDRRGKSPDAEMRKLAEEGVRGFRLYPGEIDSASASGEEGLSKMFRCAAEERLGLCLLINPDELPAVSQQCQKFPDAPVIIDHLARIGMGSPINESDVRALCALAKSPQVRVKVSAFYALGRAKPHHQDLAPLIRHVYEAFGAQRLMWGSDCPFQLMDETYEDSVSLIRDRLEFISDDDKDWILRRSAEAFFFQ
jgi:predicted TIM-barrel fold metal-dependent hydrolase